MQPYDHKQIEPKWQKIWAKNKAGIAKDPKKDTAKTKKFYALIEFPYPSGDGLHVGHIRSNTAMDIISHKRRREGYDVLYPIGWDAFGLPTENYAIKTGIQPALVTKKNTDTFRRQLKSLGFFFDWSREINTTDPKYYKWTQWIFLQFLKEGLAYKKKMTINWCPKDLIGLANEEVIDGKCERCGTPVEKREKEQWMLAITKYAEKLLEGLDAVEYNMPKLIDKTNPHQPGKPIIKRNVAHAIVFDPRTKKYLIIRNKKFGWDTVVIGGIEGNETVEETARREVREETGYIDLEFKRILGGQTEARYYTKHKGENRIAYAQAAYFELKSDKRVPLAEGEDTANEILWIDEKDFVPGKMVNSELEIWLERIKKPQLGWPKSLLDWPESIKGSQRNWIGRSEGVNFKCVIKDLGIEVEMYNSVPQSYHAETFTVIAPEHPLVLKLIAGTDREKEVLAFIEEIKLKKNQKKFDVDNDMEGIFTGRYIKDFADTGRDLPIWIASYVLADYGTGIVNASAHDSRDFVFAKKYGIPLHPIMFPADPVEAKKVLDLEYSYTRDPEAILAEPHQFKGRKWLEVREDIINHIVKAGFGTRQVNYKLRDWVFSRQRYWGEPIPVIHCDDCKTKKALLIHGFASGSDDFWFPWMKNELEKKGIEVFTPTISTSRHPTVESWTKELWPIVKKFGPNDLIIGHSLGANAALHLAERAAQDKTRGKKAGDRSIGNLLLIASAIGRPRDEKFWKWMRTHWPKLDIDALQAFWQKPLDYRVAEKGASSVTFIRSADDEIIPKETHNKLPKSWIQEEWNGYGHFDESKIIPELLARTEKIISNGMIPVPEKDLPVKLPEVKNYKPSETGESPLAAISKWVNVTCPQCGSKKAHRETDTMPNWAGSSWYYLRYTDPKNAKTFAAADKLKCWTPVDWYNGGMEHTTLHLLYSRFWHKFLFDQGLVPTSEPYTKRTSHGLILAKGGEKMSKSKGNVVNPDGIVETMGADSLRLYEMFMGPFDQAIAWDENGIVGCRRFIERVWKLAEKVNPAATTNPEIEAVVHKTIKKVSEDIEVMRFNTAVSALMIAVNEMEKLAEKSNGISPENYSAILLLLAPFAPHVTEELWQNLKLAKNKKANGKGKSTSVLESIHRAPWPVFDPSKIAESTVKIAIQINGKTRASLEMPAEEAHQMNEQIAGEKAAALDEIKKWIYGKKIKKVIYVKGRLINIVIA